MNLGTTISSFKKCLSLALALLIALILSLPTQAAQWILPRHQDDQLRWGIDHGLQFGIYPGSLSGNGTGGPRGLLRIWYPALPDGKYCLVNFIAIEPEVRGRGRAFSELEYSDLDHIKGKRISAPESAILETLASGAVELKVTFRIERFKNGAHVYCVVKQRSDRPDEIKFRLHTEDDSAPLTHFTLTATWGNITRSRLIWLKDGIVSSLVSYGNYRGNGFAPDLKFPGKDLTRTPNGCLAVAMTTNESNPAAVHPITSSHRFYYGGCPITQYWMKPNKSPQRDLSVRVNGRYVYWKSHQPVPGGVAFENFEMREPYYEGEELIFGVTPRTPKELGFSRTKNE